MSDFLTTLLSSVIFLPALGALLLCIVPIRSDRFIKQFSLAVTAVVFAITLWMAWPASSANEPGRFALGMANMQSMVLHEWIPSWNIYYFLGIDGISFPLALLTSFLSVLAMGASWPIAKHVKGYCVLFLLLETGMLGVFMSLDFFLFYVFWEVMLLPMYFLIGIWGGPRREYAAIKFFLFTLVGSVLLLVAMLMLYFNSDLRLLGPQQLADCRVVETKDAPEVQNILKDAKPVHTFNILALAEMGQAERSPFAQALWLGKSVSWWAFLFMFIGFVIKLPAVPVHTWLPEAHVEAPTPISMILAGVLLKMGGYGVLRFCYPICPDAAYELAWLVCGIGTLSMVYGAFAALAQKDFKRLVAYSSVSHMGYVLLGIGAWSAYAGNNYNADYWMWGMNGAMFQMIAHGLSSAGMFFLVGVIYDRVHHRNLDQFGGLFAKMPLYSGISVGIFFAALGLPGLCGFIGEVFVVLGCWSYSTALAVLAASVVVLTAGYILWTIQRVYLGAEYKGPHGDAITPITFRETAIAVPLLALAVVFGVYPKAMFDYMSPSIDKTVNALADWTRGHEKQKSPGDIIIGGVTPRIIIQEEEEEKLNPMMNDE
ncbi:MAG: NADH-quinone oxidoreductase subunit M [Pirellulales bacterium]|nr:NADH-quinone oxidoreductase subunit M [Pirellulales bacterium]